MKTIAKYAGSLLLAGLFVAALAGAPSEAVADNCDDEQSSAEDGNKKNYKTIVGADGKKTFVIEKAFVVCGKVPKPTVLYAIQASTINYEWENLKKDFIPLILKTVKEAPF